MDFFRFSLNQTIIHEHLLLSAVNNTQPLDLLPTLLYAVVSLQMYLNASALSIYIGIWTLCDLKLVYQVNKKVNTIQVQSCMSYVFRMLV